MLVEQYRMNSLIMQWSSTHLYSGRLVAHSSVSDRTLSDLLTNKGVDADGEAIAEANDDDDIGVQPLIFIDTAGALMYEAVDQEVGKNESKYNFGEVDLVI